MKKIMHPFFKTADPGDTRQAFCLHRRISVFLLCFLLSAAALICPAKLARAASAGTGTGTSAESETGTDPAVTPSPHAYAAKTVSPYTGKTYHHPSRFKDCEILHGVDVSKYQGMNINWNKVKAAGIDFAFIRIGHSWFAGDGKGNLLPGSDECFEINYRNARAAGIPVGVYYFSQAVNEAEAHREAAYVLNIMRGRKLELPIVFDSEDSEEGRLHAASPSRSVRTALTRAFCQDIEKAGYRAMIYGGLSEFNENMNIAELETNWPIWFARYNDKTGYSRPYTFWQYSDNGKVSGIPGGVDMNFWYKPASEALPTPELAGNPVTGLTVARTGTKSLSLRFDAMTAASGYEIWRAEAWDGVYQRIGEITGTSYADANLSSGREYYYQVRARITESGTSRWGEFSDIAFGSTAQTVEHNVTANRSVYLRKHAGSAYGTITMVPAGTVCRLLSVTRNVDGTAWYHVGVSVNGTTVEGYLSSSAADFAISRVSGVKLRKSYAKSLTLSWNGQTGIDGYRIYMAKSRTGSSQLVKIVPAGKTSCKITGLAKYTQYYFRVSAYIQTIGQDEQTAAQFSEGAVSARLTAETKHTRLKLRAKSKIYLRKYAGSGYKKQKKIPKKTKMTADYRTRDKSGKWWYHVKVTLGRKKYTGFVKASYTKKR